MCMYEFIYMYPQELWEVLGLCPKTHYEEYHRTPKYLSNERNFQVKRETTPTGLTRFPPMSKMKELSFVAKRLAVLPAP